MITGEKMNPLPQSRRGLELHHAEIDRLPTDLKAALAAACTQRQAEVYRAYARRTRTPTSAAFDNLLNAIWEKIRCRQAHGAKEHMEWEGHAERLYPGDAAKPDVYLGRARIAVLALLHSIHVLWTHKAQDTCSAAHETFMSIYNTLTGPIGEKPQIDLNEPNAIERIFAHPLIQAEHHRQERDLHEVQQALLRPGTIPAVVDELRRRSAREAKDFVPIVERPRR
jgi:hypothetical protein